MFKSCCRPSTDTRATRDGGEFSEKSKDHDEMGRINDGANSHGPKVLFAFGPHDTYIFQTPHGRNLKNLPEPFNRECGISDSYGVEVASCAFGKHGKYVGLFSASSDSPVAKANHQRHENLLNWLKLQVTSTQSIRTLRINTASDPATFFAYLWDRNCGPTYRWSNLPEQCEEELQDLVHFNRRYSPDYHPVQVTFGVGGDYVILFSDGEWAADSSLRHYRELQEVLEDEDGLGIEFIALNPFAAEEFFILFRNGTCRWRVPKLYADELEQLARGLLPEPEGKAVEEGDDAEYHGHQSVSGFTKFD